MMHVLLARADPDVGADIARVLARAGHQVIECRGGPRCPLARDGSCPVLDRRVDVMVDVRDCPSPFAPSELPMLCASLAGIPTVVCGPVPSAGGPWRHADVLCDATDIVRAVEEAASASSPAAETAVRRAISGIVEQEGLPGPDQVALDVTGGVVDVTLTFARTVVPRARERIVQATHQSLVPYTPHWAHARIHIVDEPVGEAEGLTPDWLG